MDMEVAGNITDKHIKQYMAWYTYIVRGGDKFDKRLKYGLPRKPLREYRQQDNEDRHDDNEGSNDSEDDSNNSNEEDTCL